MKILHKDGRKEIWKGNALQGYITPEDDLYGIGADSYAHFICIVTHESEAIPALKNWKKNAT